MTQLTEQAVVRRLYDRFGFGLGGGSLAAAQARSRRQAVVDLIEPTGTDRGAAATPPPALERLTRPSGGAGGDRSAKRAWRRAMRQQVEETTLWWLDRMVAADHPLPERLTWFWHGHFATSAQKVRSAPLMLAQNETQRRLGGGDFGRLAQAMIVDPAMLIWLDGSKNTARAPNENLSREFLELFTLGHGNFTEDDVREGARALTGWRVDRLTGQAVLRPQLHDAATKIVFDQAADFDAHSLVAAVLAQPAASDHVIGRLWARMVSATPPSASSLQRLRDAYGTGRDITALLWALVLDPAFSDSDSTLVKQPVEWAVGLMRAVGLAPRMLPPGERRRLLRALRGLGQVPLLPPSVGGWPAGAAWLTTSAALARLDAARLITAHATWPAEVAGASTRRRPEALRRLLGVDHFAARTLDAVAAVADRLPMAAAVAACSPEYTVSI